MSKLQNPLHPSPDSTRHPIRRAVISLAAGLAGLCGGPALASDYHYWYHDDNAWFQPGDLSLGWQKLTPPAWACGRRFFQGAELKWVGEFANVIHSQEENVAVNVHTRGAVGGCKAKPLVERHFGLNNQQVIPGPAQGTHYLEIDPDAGSHWFDKDGQWPFCGACALPAGFTAAPGDIRWPALDRAFGVQLEAVGAGHCKRCWIELQSFTQPVADLRRLVAAEVSRRRLQSFGELEIAVRQLEDLTLASLDKAAAQLEQTRLAQSAGATGEAYKAFSQARRSVALAHTALRTVVDEVRR